MSNQYKLQYKIVERYSNELSEIDYILKNMKSGLIYGINGHTCTGYGSLETNCEKLATQFYTLLKKIQLGLDAHEMQISEVSSIEDLKKIE